MLSVFLLALWLGTGGERAGGSKFAKPIAPTSCDTSDTYSVISLVRLQSELLLGEELLLPQLLDLHGEDLLRWRGGVNAVGLDGDEHTTTLLQEELGVQGDDTSLVGLGNTTEVSLYLP